jgi:DNA polymerase III subunit gamma/tau
VPQGALVVTVGRPRSRTMTYQVLARRLRPQRFEDVVGQDHVTRTLQAAIAAGRVAHAFLFTGPRGVGKTTTARLLAKALQCEGGPTPEPCNACANCREIAEGNAFDVLEIDGASHTQVDKMRDLMDTVAHRPIRGRFKIFIIDEVHMLSSHSFNALLKTLEEPPPHVKFIFATTDPHKVLPTVVSRCQRYDLRRIGLGELRAHLRQTVDAEGIGLSDEAVALVAREAEGSLRDAQSLLEQVLTVAGTGADERAVREVLGAADRRLVGLVAEAILAGDPGAAVRHLAALHAHGYDPQRFCRDLLEHFRHLALLAATGDRTLLADLPDAELEPLVAQAGRRSADDLQRFFRLLLDADETLSTPARTVDPKLVLEMAAVRLATLPPLLPVDDILQRLEALAGGAPVPAVPAPAPRGGTRTSAVPAPARAGATAAEEPLWERVLERVREEKLALYLALEPARPLPGDGDAFRIGVDNESLRRDLSRKDNLDRLVAIVSQVAGRPLRVELAPLPKEQVVDTPTRQARRRTEETLADPMVKAAVEIFGGEVRGVRDRRGS